MNKKEIEMTKNLKQINAFTLAGGRSPLLNGDGSHRLLLNGDEGAHSSPYLVTKSSPRFAKVAFTLAEVLITLGVIGVVAAMTLPTLVQNYKKKAYATRIHKTYAELLQAIKLSEIDNGPINEFNTTQTGIQRSIEFVDTYIKPYYKDLNLCSTGTDTKCGGAVSIYGANYINRNGVSMAMSYRNNGLDLIIDITGQQGPSIFGIDKFYFNTRNSKNMLLPYAYDINTTRKQILQGYNYNNSFLSCKKSATEENELNRHGCTLLLYLDNWEIKDDYPW